MYTNKDLVKLKKDHSPQELLAAARSNLELWNAIDEGNGFYLGHVKMDQDLCLKIINESEVEGVS